LTKKTVKQYLEINTNAYVYSTVQTPNVTIKNSYTAVGKWYNNEITKSN